MSPPPWAYQVDAFEPPPDEELVCSICRSVFCDPVRSPCNHVYCRGCINKWLENNRNCPICRKRTSQHSIREVVPLIRNMIMKLTLKCHNEERGCEDKFPLEACEAHVKDCVYEMVKCKNKPCKQMILRRDRKEHELHDCSHRCVQCKKCGLKVSSVGPQKHNCIEALRQCLMEKDEMIQKKSKKIKALEKEIKTLKENEQGESDSMDDSIREAAIMMRDMTDFSSDSSLSSTNFDDPFWMPSTSEILNGLERRYNRERQAFLADDNSIEYPRASSPTVRASSTTNLNASASSANRSTDDEPRLNVSSASANRSTDDEPRFIRPAKRRLPTQLLDSTDDERENGLQVSLPSPKRVWRLHPRNGANATTQSPSEESSASPGGVAGPSSDPSTSAGSSSTTVLTTSPMITSSKLRPRSQGRAQEERAAPPPPVSIIGLSNPVGGTFERTIALLSQYNLESDPEWMPTDPEDLENDSDSSVENPLPARDGYITSSDESSLSDSASESSFEVPPGKVNIFEHTFSSSDEDE